MRDTIETHGGGWWRDRGVWALTVYYFGVWADNLKFTPARWLLGKVYGLLSIMSEIVTGVKMDRSLQLPGKGLHIIHPTSLYIHRKSILGERVGFMHNVCLGTNMRGDEAPVIGDDVFIGTGSSILGPVKVGNGARIAANSLVINDVPPGAFAIGVPAKNIMMPSVRSQMAKREEVESAHPEPGDDSAG